MCWEGFCKSQQQAVPSRLQQSVHGCIAQRLQEWGRSRGLSVSRRGANDGAEIEIVIEGERGEWVGGEGEGVEQEEWFRGYGGDQGIGVDDGAGKVRPCLVGHVKVVRPAMAAPEMYGRRKGRKGRKGRTGKGAAGSRRYETRAPAAAPASIRCRLVSEFLTAEGYSLDIAVPELKVAIEVDGPSHFVWQVRLSLSLFAFSSLQGGLNARPPPLFRSFCLSQLTLLLAGQDRLGRAGRSGGYGGRPFVKAQHFLLSHVNG